MSQAILWPIPPEVFATWRLNILSGPEPDNIISVYDSTTGDYVTGDTSDGGTFVAYLDTGVYDIYAAHDGYYLDYVENYAVNSQDQFVTIPDLLPELLVTAEFDVSGVGCGWHSGTWHTGDLQARIADYRVKNTGDVPGDIYIEIWQWPNNPLYTSMIYSKTITCDSGDSCPINICEPVNVDIPPLYDFLLWYGGSPGPWDWPLGARCKGDDEPEWPSWPSGLQTTNIKVIPSGWEDMSTTDEQTKQILAFGLIAGIVGIPILLLR